MSRANSMQLARLTASVEPGATNASPVEASSTTVSPRSERTTVMALPLFCTTAAILVAQMVCTSVMEKKVNRANIFRAHIRVFMVQATKRKKLFYFLFLRFYRLFLYLCDMYLLYYICTKEIHFLPYICP